MGEHQARLVVVDPLMQFVDGNANSDQSMRKSIWPLADFAPANWRSRASRPSFEQVGLGLRAVSDAGDDRDDRLGSVRIDG